MLSAREPYALAVNDIPDLVEEMHSAGYTVILGGDPQTDILDGPKANSQLTQKQVLGAYMPYPTISGRRRFTMDKGGNATRIGDILVSEPSPHPGETYR